MRAERLLLPGVLGGAMLGILADDTGIVDGALAPAALGGAIALIVGALARRPIALVAGAALLAATCGAWRGAATALPVGPGSIASMADGTERRVQGTVIDEPRPRGERQQVILDQVRVAPGDGDPRPAPGRLLVWLPRAVVVGAGDRLAFQARLEPPRDFDGFAYREYLARQGIGATASAFRADVSSGTRGVLADALAGLRAALQDGLNRQVPEPEAALGAGILLGARAGIAPEVSDSFATAGLTHVVAISGWNIAIVAALAAGLARPLLRLPGGRVAAVLVSAASVGGYVLLTGASPSVVRAALMGGALVLARLGGSRAHAASALMAAALGMVLAAPPVLWDVGFQLSALATAGLIWFGSGMESLLRRWPAVVREPVALTLAAQLTTLPVILLNFERLSLVAPLANVLVVPLVPLVMLASALASVAGALALPIASEAIDWAVGGAAWLYLRLMILAGTAAAGVPLASVEIGAPPALGAAWYPLLLLLHRRIRRRAESRGVLVSASLGGAVRPLPVVGATLAILACLTLATRPDGRLHLIMLDVGQGDAILVRAPSGATLLIDGGPDPDLAARRIGESLPFWQRSIDVVVLSHPHEDHVAGLMPALERYRVARVLDPGRAYENPTYPRFRSLAEAEAAGAWQPARAGQRIHLDPETTLTILFPAEDDAVAPLPDGDINNASVVALLEYGSFRALLTGDAEIPVEALLLQRGLLGQVDVLKVGHHGSDSSTGRTLLDVTAPRWALISAGVDNEYGHPHAITLEHLAAIPGLQVLRTDRDGTVEIVVDGSGIRVQRHGRHDPGSIGPWPSPPWSARRRSLPRASSRRGSSGTPGESSAWRWRRRAWWPRPGSPLMGCSSRSPPCCTTSTSPRRAVRWRTA